MLGIKLPGGTQETLHKGLSGSRGEDMANLFQTSALLTEENIEIYIYIFKQWSTRDKTRTEA